MINAKLSGITLNAIGASLLVGGVFMLSPGEAEAYVKCDITAICSQTAQMEGQMTRNRISQMQDAVSAAVDRARSDIVQAIGQSTAGISSAVSKNTGIAGQNQAELEKDRAKNEAEREVAPTSCGNAGASQGPRGGGSGGSVRPSGPGSNYEPSNVDERLKEAMNVANQTRTPQLPDKDANKQHADLAVGACRTFVVIGSIRAQMCEKVSVTPSAKNRFPDADIKAATLFDGPQAEGATLKNISVPVQGPERDARAAFLTMNNSASVAPWPPGDISKSVNGTPYLGLRMEYETAKSMAAYPSQEYDRLTTVDPATKPALEQIAKEDGEFLKRYFKDLPKQSYENGVSPAMLNDIEVERRIGNVDWLKRMAAADANTKAAEQLMISAYNLRLQRDLVTAQLQTNVLLGKMLNNSNEETYRVRLEDASRDLVQTATQAKDTGSSTSQSSNQTK